MKKRLRATAFLAIQALAALLYGFILPPGSALRAPCLFRSLTGLFCPGCGMGRGLWAILHGDIIGGLRQNILLALVIPLVGAIDVDLIRAVLGKRGILDEGRTAARILRSAAIPLAIAVLAFWILRNLPMRPFSLLAPS